LDLDGLDCRELADGVTVKVKVQPRASRNAVSGIVGDSLKLALTSPPVDGAANSACTSYFAEICRVAKSRVEIISGHKSRDKVIKISGLDKASLFAVLKER